MRDSKRHYNKNTKDEFILRVFPENEYEAVLRMWGSSYCKGTKKLIMLWEIVSDDKKINGLLFPRYYNLSRWDRKTRTPIPMPGSLWADVYKKFHGEPRTVRGYNPEKFSDEIYVVKIMVSKENDGKPKPKEKWFSEVTEIVRKFHKESSFV